MRYLVSVFRLTTPPWNVFQWGYDKRLTYQLADNVAVSHPWTAYPANREEILASQYPYPVILKPAYRSCLNRFTAAKAWRIENREQLLARYDEACTLADPAYLDGSGAHSRRRRIPVFIHRTVPRRAAHRITHCKAMPADSDGLWARQHFR